MRIFDRKYKKILKFNIKKHKKNGNKYLLSKAKTVLRMYRVFKYLYRPIRNKKIKALKWCVYDIICGKWFNRKLWGVYAFCALPGEGKTLSMIMHIERQLLDNPDIKIYTNFGYKKQTAPLLHWTDIIKYTIQCYDNKESCIIGFDEMHLTFNCNDRTFPPALLTALSFDRKLGMQFLCTTQIYDKLHKNVRDLTNYVVLCENVLKQDRLFTNHYYDIGAYEAMFDGKKAKSTFIRQFVATNRDYSLYETRKLIKSLTSDKENEIDKVREALNLLLGTGISAE